MTRKERFLGYYGVMIGFGIGAVCFFVFGFFLFRNYQNDTDDNAIQLNNTCEIVARSQQNNIDYLFSLQRPLANPSEETQNTRRKLAREALRGFPKPDTCNDGQPPKHTEFPLRPGELPIPEDELNG